jgi:hypothetical protein
MHIFAVRYDLLALWEILSVIAKLYVSFLLLSFVYASYILPQALARLQSLHSRKDPIEVGLSNSTLLRIEQSIENVRQLQLLLLLLFGLTFANEVFSTLRGIRYSSMSLSAATIDVFEPRAAFSFVVFGALTLLHIFQWIATIRLRRNAAP